MTRSDGPTDVPEVSVVVLTYDGQGYIDACLGSLRDQDPAGPAYEVLVFDNASTDGTPERVGEAHPWVRLVRSDRNLGFAAGNVAALAHARGRWVVFLNQDTVVGRRFVAGLVDAVRVGGATAAQANMILPWQPCARDLDRSAPHPDLHVAELTRAAYVAYGIEPDGPATAPSLFLSGAAFIIDRRILDRIGGLFDPDFWAYCEDTDLALRLRSAGASVVTVREAVVYHDLTPATGLRPAAVAKTIRILRNRHLACLRSMRASEYGRVLPRLLLEASGKIDELPLDGAHRLVVRIGMPALSVVGLAWAIASLPRHRRARAATLARRVGGPAAILTALDEADARVRRRSDGARAQSPATTTDWPA